MGKKTHDEFIAQFQERNAHYNNIEILGTYVTFNTPIKCRCKICKHEWNALPSVLLRGNGCRVCGRKIYRNTRIQNTKIKLPTVIAEINPNVELIGEYISCNDDIKLRCKKCEYIWDVNYSVAMRNKCACPNCRALNNNRLPVYNNETIQKRIDQVSPTVELVGDYISMRDKVLFRCRTCNNEWYGTASYILSGRICPKCAKYNATGYATKGANDIATERPDLVKYFLNIDDAYLYRKMSGEKVKLKCPDCGNVKEQFIYNLTQQGFSCPICSDKISYPNKFGRAFVEQLPVTNIDTEFTSDWTKKFRYDIYFEYDNCKYILEMDGMWHSEDNSLSGQTAEKTKSIDLIKDNLATEHGIKIIRIDCAKSRKNYIKESIINSVLSSIFDLSNIDWEKCDNRAQGNTHKYICDYYNSHPDKAFAQIARDLHISRDTVSRSLRKGNEFGWCVLDKEQMDKNRRKANGEDKCIPVEVYTDDMKLLYKFPSVRECCKKMKKIYDTFFSEAQVCRSRGNLYKGFRFIKERERYGEKICTS